MFARNGPWIRAGMRQPCSDVFHCQVRFTLELTAHTGCDSGRVHTGGEDTRCVSRCNQGRVQTDFNFGLFCQKT